MVIKAFIGWSGDLSCRLAKEITSWLPKVLHNVKPCLSPDDLEKGIKWDPEISKELIISQIGLICLTQENMDKPWTLFVSGALSNKMGNANVYPILFDFEPKELKGPLVTFQITGFIKDDFKKLISTINNSCGDMKLELKIFEEKFEERWPKLDEKIKSIISTHKADSKKDPRTEKDILIEILELIRMLVKAQVGFEVTQVSSKVDIDNLAPRKLLVRPIIADPDWASIRGLAYFRKDYANKLRSSSLEKKRVSKALKPDEKK